MTNLENVLDQVLATDVKFGYMWVPCMIMSIYNLIVMYGLDAPRSVGSRISRVFAIMGNLMGLFSPLHVVISATSYAFLLFAFCVLNTQYYRECHTRKRNEAKVRTILGIPPDPPASSTLARVAETIVGKRDPLRREDYLFLGAENKRKTTI